MALSNRRNVARDVTARQRRGGCHQPVDQYKVVHDMLRSRGLAPDGEGSHVACLCDVLDEDDRRARGGGNVFLK